MPDLRPDNTRRAADASPSAEAECRMLQQMRALPYRGRGFFRGNEMVEYSVATRFARVYQPYRGGVRLSLPECLEPYAVRRGAPYGGREQLP